MEVKGCLVKKDDLFLLLNADLVIKQERFIQAVLGKQVSSSHKRVFRALIEKITPIDVGELVLRNQSLVIVLTEQEYSEMFPSDFRISELFQSAVKYYIGHSHLLFYSLIENEIKCKAINLLDSAIELKDGGVQFTFTREGMQFLSEIKDSWSSVSIQDFSRLSAKYSQRLFHLFCNFDSQQINHPRILIEDFRELLSIPDSYNNSRLIKNVLDVSFKEINKKTSLNIQCVALKGVQGNAFQFFDFVIHRNNKKPLLEE